MGKTIMSTEWSRYPPKVAISKLVNSLKGVSRRMLRQERPDLRAATGKACCGLLILPPVAAVLLATFSSYTEQQKKSR